jgi:hypothetical protein
MWRKQKSVCNFDVEALECGHFEDQIGHKGNIKMYVMEFGCEDGKWMDFVRIMSNGRLS